MSSIADRSLRVIDRRFAAGRRSFAISDRRESPPLIAGRQVVDLTNERIGARRSVMRAPM